jgi:hypothetical protein
MRVPNAVHLQQRWVISEIAHDFDLLDVWALPARGEPDEFHAFVETMASLDPSNAGSAASRMLFRTREILGRLLRWDQPDKTRPIPGCSETSLQMRVPRALRATADGLRVSDALRHAGARALFITDDEAALEIANDTVHGVLHFSLVRETDGLHRPHMAIYVKPHGLLGRLYLKAIAPFRHLIVYPALMRQIERAWSAREGGVG